ncbi:helix-turn-helix domain-containing protein [Staphylococcus equorum]|uniref:helix-turn-helix domain-containing protein n=1 Tax=Staphylococcus equorum TaxID=246432 RepID=UPI00192D0761|nr:helix-turn-helix transcriptional regulator [Staphylococcus equorum]
MFDNKILHNRIQKELENQDLSIAEFARITRITEGGIRYIMKKSNPTAENLYNIAIALNVSVDYLLGLKNERN